MRRFPVLSSKIASASYDDEENLLEIEFTDNTVYQYQNVPRSEFDNLFTAISKGQYFENNIKGRYAYTRL